MLGNILKGSFVLVGTHGRLAENELFIRIADGQMSTFLVIFGPLTAFHHKGSVLLGKVGKDFEIQSGTQVVRVGNKHVLESVLEKGVEAARTFQSGVQVTVTRWAPFVGCVSGASSRLKMV